MSLTDVLVRGVVENVGHGIAGSLKREAQTARIGVGAPALRLASYADAADEGDGPVDCSDEVAKDDLLWVARQLEAAAGSLSCLDKTRKPQSAHDLLEERQRNQLLFGDFGEANWALLISEA